MAVVTTVVTGGDGWWRVVPSPGRHRASLAPNPWGRAIVISKPSGVENNNKQQAAEARFGVRRLPGLLPKNRRQIRTQRGPLTPKPPSFSW